jgi:hypothetical protein
VTPFELHAQRLARRQRQFVGQVTAQQDQARAKPRRAFDHVAVEVEDRGFAPRLHPRHADLRHLRPTREEPCAGDLGRHGADARHRLDQRQPGRGLGQRRRADAALLRHDQRVPLGRDEKRGVIVFGLDGDMGQSPTVRERMNSARPPIRADMKMKMKTPTATPVIRSAVCALFAVR